MHRCRCGPYFTLAAVVYGIIIVFMFGRYFQQSITVFQIKNQPSDKDNGQENKQHMKNGNIQTVKDGQKVPEVPFVNGMAGVAPKIVPKKKIQKLILLTYMRCGSSLTGDLLSQHPDVFYVYEPLWQTQHNYLDGKPTKYLDGKVITDMDPAEYWAPYAVSSEVLKIIGTCQFQLLDIGSLKQPHLHSSRSTQPYARCRRKKSLNLKNNETYAIESCLDLLKNPCEKAKVIFSKVIRFTVAQLQYLLQMDPSVKAIYLLRDPRGSLYSQSMAGEFKWKTLRNESWHFCDRVMKDLTLAKDMSQAYPNQILTVRYEDLAEHPQAATELLYNFAGIQMSDRIRTYIRNRTSAGKSGNRSRGTTRSNSAETAYRWRSRVRYEDAVVIQNMCYHVLKVMGYRKFLSKEEYMNKNLLPRLDKFGDGFNTIDHVVLQGMAAKS